MGRYLTHLKVGTEIIHGYRCSKCGSLTIWNNEPYCSHCFNHYPDDMDYIPTDIEITINIKEVN